MDQSLILGAYWSAREETINECAQRLQTFLAKISTIDESLCEWYERGRSREEALSRQIEIENHDALVRLLDKGRNRRDIGNEVIEKLGFRIGVWNGHFKDNDEASLSILCGSYSKATLNSLVLALPKAFKSKEFFEQVRETIACASLIWEPDWAGVMTNSAMRARNFSARRPFVDWMVFVPRSIKSVAPPATVTPLAKGGCLIVTQSQPPLSDDADAQARIHAIENLILN
jgi:hypothetical protein